MISENARASAEVLRVHPRPPVHKLKPKPPNPPRAFFRRDIWAAHFASPKITGPAARGVGGGGGGDQGLRRKTPGGQSHSGPKPAKRQKLFLDISAGAASKFLEAGMRPTAINPL
jgi:hypothetical protein